MSQRILSKIINRILRPVIPNVLYLIKLKARCDFEDNVRNLTDFRISFQPS